jgi:very-short-patch-repair endonuclease
MKVYDEARTGAVQRARELRRDSTDAEKRLWRALRTSLPQFKWRRQMPIGPYFADFACFAEMLVVELDGGQHAKTAGYDAARTRFIQAQGYRVLRFWNNDALSNAAGVLEQISLSLGRGKEQRRLREGEADSSLPQSTSPSRASGAHPSPDGRGNLETCQ